MIEDSDKYNQQDQQDYVMLLPFFFCLFILSIRFGFKIEELNLENKRELTNKNRKVNHQAAIREVIIMNQVYNRIIQTPPLI